MLFSGSTARKVCKVEVVWAVLFKPKNMCNLKQKRLLLRLRKWRFFMMTFSSAINSALLWWSAGHLRFCVQNRGGCASALLCRSALCLLLTFLPTCTWVSMEKSLEAETPVAMVSGTPCQQKALCFCERFLGRSG